MQKNFKNQKLAACLYTVIAVLVFLYTLCFMTEYKDLFGLKLKQNNQVSFFHDSVLQMFNKQIFVFALLGIILILLTFLFQVFSRVPDKFALVIIELILLICCIGSIYAIINIQAIEVFYAGLDFQYLQLEGMSDYVPRFTTFRIGLGIYIANIISCVTYGISIGISHFKFLKMR